MSDSDLTSINSKSEKSWNLFNSSSFTCVIVSFGAAVSQNVFRFGVLVLLRYSLMIPPAINVLPPLGSTPIK